MTGKELWTQVINDSAIARTYFVLSPAVHLLGEAVICYDSKAYFATCLCARAAIEASLHIAKTTTRVEAKEIHAPKSAQIELSDSRWRDLLSWAIEFGLIDNALKGRIQKARKLGNLGAHLAQIRARSYRRARAASLTRGIQIGVNRADASNCLSTCRDLLLRIASQRWSPSV